MNKKVVAVFVLILILGGMLLITTPKRSSPSDIYDTSSWDEYEDFKYGFTLKYPSEWEEGLYSHIRRSEEPETWKGPMFVEKTDGATSIPSNLQNEEEKALSLLGNLNKPIVVIEYFEDGRKEVMERALVDISDLNARENYKNTYHFEPEDSQLQFFFLDLEKIDPESLFSKNKDVALFSVKNDFSSTNYLKVSFIEKQRPMYDSLEFFKALATTITFPEHRE